MAETKKRGRKPVNPDQPAVIQAWIDLASAHRGFRPTIDQKVYRAANLLLRDFSVDDIRQMIEVAFRDGWFAANGTLMSIKSNPDKYRPHVVGSAPTQESTVPYHAEWKPSW